MRGPVVHDLVVFVLLVLAAAVLDCWDWLKHAWRCARAALRRSWERRPR